MKERVRINLVERSKEIQADVTLEREGEGIDHQQLLKDQLTLFDLARKAATERTMRKVLP